MPHSFPQPSRILSFQSALASSAESGLALVGGKGANLARLFQAGLPVPDGFLLTTQAYRDFVHVNRLEERILAALPPPNCQDPGVLEAASRKSAPCFPGVACHLESPMS